jgi:predicted nucleotidyltransferase
MPLTEHAILQITAVLAADQRLIAASLIGSALSARFRPDSDVDVALLPKSGTRLSALDLVELAAPLEEAVGHPVHLGELSTRSLIYAKEAIAEGRWLFCHDIPTRDLFAATALALYVQLRYERREIEAAYAAA